jgi:HSP20 family protein
MADNDLVTTKPLAPEGRLAEPINWLRREVDRVFDDLMPRAGRLFDFSANLTFPKFPLVEVKDKDDEYRISADVPGFQPDQISVTVTDGVLVISGETDETTRSDEDGLVVEERHRGSFERRIALPGATTGDGIKAKLKNGVLKIAVPKAKTASAKPVPVEVEG